MGTVNADTFCLVPRIGRIIWRDESPVLGLLLLRPNLASRFGGRLPLNVLILLLEELLNEVISLGKIL